MNEERRALVVAILATLLYVMSIWAGYFLPSLILLLDWMMGG